MAKHTALIHKLWQSEADRAIAHRFVEAFSGPGMDDRIPSMLQEAASTADRIAAGEISMEDGRGYLASFASEGLGAAPHLMNGLSDWFDSTAAEMATAETQQPPAEQPAAPAQAQPAQVQPPVPPAPAPAPPAGPSRQQRDDRIKEIETKYMAAPRNTPEGKAYWTGGIAEEYRDLVTARDMPETAAPPTIAGGAAAPQPGGDAAA